MAEPNAQPEESDDLLADEAQEIEQLKTEIKGEPKPEIAAKTEADPEVEEGDDPLEIENKGKFVRHGALHQERERRKAEQKARQEVEARYASDMARANERLSAILAQQQQATRVEAPVQVPDKNTDPIAYYDHQLAAQQKKLDEADKFRQQYQAQQDQQTRLSAVQREVERLETQFKQTTPDYDQAYAHLQERWAAEAKAVGVSAEEAIAARTLETIQIAARMNKNPAEVAYQRALALGYSKEQKAPPQVDLDTIARGQATSKSPTTAPGKPAGQTTIESILAMDDDEFADKFGTKDFQKLRNKALGLV